MCVRAASKEEQRRKEEDAADCLDPASGQAPRQRQQGCALVHRPEQHIEEHGHGDLARHLEHVHRERGLVEAPVRQDVAGRRRRVAVDDQPLRDETLREDPRQEGDQEEEAGHPGQGLWTIRHAIASRPARSCTAWDGGLAAPERS